MKKYIITIIIFLLIFIATGFLFNSLYHFEQKKYETSLKSEIQQQTIILSNTLWYLFDNYISDIKLVSSFLGYKDEIPTTDNLKFLYKNLVKPEMNLLNIVFLGNDGTQLNTYPKIYSNSNNLNYSLLDYFKECQKTSKTVMSKPSMNYQAPKTAQKNRSVIIMAPVINPKNKKFGYVLLNINTVNLKDLIQYKNQESDFSSISFYLIDTNNNEILCAPPRLRSRKFSLSSKDFCSFIINFSKSGKESHNALTKISGKKVYISSTRLKIANNSLAVVAVVPYKDTINYTADFSRRISFIIIYIGLMLFMVAAFVIYNEVIVKKLRKKISRLEIIIDERTKESHMDGIVQTKYFKSLEDKIKSIKIK